MKDYAKRSSGASLKPNRHSTIETPDNPDRWLIVFIVCSLTLAAASAFHTFYQQWREKHPLAIATTIAPPAKATPEKATHKTPVNKADLEPTEKPKTLEKTVKTKAKTSDVITDDDKPVITAEPKYDFYQILPKMTVDVPKNTDANNAPETD